MIELAVLAAVAVALPHRFTLDRIPPALGAAIWFAALALRALLAVLLAVLVVVLLPATDVLQVVSHWCLDEMLPFLTESFPLNGHALGDLAVVAPGLLLATSLVWAAVGLWRAARTVARTLVRRAHPGGPATSVIVNDRAVMVAAAGLRHPRVVVSSGALLLLDDEELAASLDHEAGHIQRGHRFVMVVAELLRAVGRFLPGTGRAAFELSFHLERDADHYALRRRHAPAALASAICKAAVGSAPLPQAALALSGGAVVRRVTALLDDPGPATAGSLRASRVGLAGLVALVLFAGVQVPGAVATGVTVAQASVPPHHCSH